MPRPEELFAEFLSELGLSGDPEMQGTPERVSEFLAEFVPVADPPLAQILPTASNDPVVLRDLPFYSLCAHHLVPFFGHVTIAYQPEGRIAGLGHFPRLVRHFARRPQLQERLASQLADAVQTQLKPTAVLVSVTARQLCMEMRGPESTGQTTVAAQRGDVSPLLTWLTEQAT